MKMLAALLMLAAMAGLARSEEVWRWTNAEGTICYSNRLDAAPPEATPVTTRLVIEADRLPGAPDLAADRGMVIDPVERRRKGSVRRNRVRPIYGEERLRFGCYASSVLFSGGWSHPDDIAVIGNCLPYLLGPEAWLNAARAELGLREHGLDWRQLVPMYLAEGAEAPRGRLTHVSRRY